MPCAAGYSRQAREAVRIDLLHGQLAVLAAERLVKRAVCRSPIQIRQPTIPTTASTRKAPLSPPVLRLTKPMRSGPKNAPLAPTALMSAIDAAAAVPLNSIAGRHQKAGWNTAPPIGISASAATRSPEVGAIANPMQPTDMSARPKAAYPHRSALRSERAAAIRYCVLLQLGTSADSRRSGYP
jgi:hypothetical protein